MRERIFLLLPAVLLLSGCITQRTVSFPNHDYDTLFKSTVAGLCQREDLIVYGADKRNGIISVQGRGLMIGAPNAQITIGGAAGGMATAKVFPIPAQEYYLEIINQTIPPAAAPAAVPAPTTTPAQDLELEKQKLELEKQKLQLEREKLEFEKQKQQQQP